MLPFMLPDIWGTCYPQLRLALSKCISPAARSKPDRQPHVLMASADIDDHPIYPHALVAGAWWLLSFWCWHFGPGWWKWAGGQNPRRTVFIPNVSPLQASHKAPSLCGKERKERRGMSQEERQAGVVSSLAFYLGFILRLILSLKTDLWTPLLFFTWLLGILLKSNELNPQLGSLVCPLLHFFIMHTLKTEPT